LLLCLAFPAAAREVHLEESRLPKDFKDLGMRGFHLYDVKAIAVFKDRVQFHRFPPELRLGPEGLSDPHGPTTLPQYRPVKTLRFSVPFEIVTRGYSLICTHPSSPKASRRGVEDFCGVVDLDGNVVYRFPFEQHVPNDMLQIIGMSDDGQYAEVFLGKYLPSPDDRRFQVAQPREILAWWYPNRVVRYPGPWANGDPKDFRKAYASVFREFGARKRGLDTE